MKLLWILLLSTCCFAINSRTGWTSAYVRDSFQDSGLVAGGTVKATTNGKLILGVPDTAGKCYRASTADTVTSWIEWAKIHGAPSIPAAYDSAGHAGISDSSKKYDNRYQATLTNPVTGAGTSGFFPLWSGTTTLGNSVAKQISTIDVTVKANFADTGNTYISGFLGIGQAPSSNYGALINQTSTYTGSGDVCGVYGGMAYTPSSTGGSLYGLNFSPSLLGTNSTIRVVGVLGNVVINAGSGACGDIIPNRSALTITGSSARTFTNFYGMKLDITNAGPALTGTNAYQLYLNDYSSALTATNHYGIFQNATALPNVLYSATAIGEVGGSATTPYANLHVMDLSAGAGIKNAIQISGGNTNTGDGVGIMFNHYYGSTAYYNWQAAQLSAGYSAVPAGGYGTTFILKTNTGAGLNTLDTVFSGNTVSMVIKPSLTLRSLATGRPYSTAGVISIAALTAAEMPDSSASTKFHNVKVDSLFAVTGIKSTNGYHGGPADTTINAKRAVFADSSTNTHKADTAINCKYAVKSDSSRASHVSDTSLKTDNRYLGLHNTADSAKSSGQAAKLITSRTIGGTSFDGTGNIVPDTTNKAHTVNGGQVVSDTFNNHGTVIDKKGNVWLSGQAMEIGCGDSIYPHPSDVELFSSVYNVGSPYPFNENGNAILKARTNTGAARDIIFATGEFTSPKLTIVDRNGNLSVPGNDTTKGNSITNGNDTIVGNLAVKGNQNTWGNRFVSGNDTTGGNLAVKGDFNSYGNIYGAPGGANFSLTGAFSSQVVLEATHASGSLLLKSKSGASAITILPTPEISIDAGVGSVDITGTLIGGIFSFLPASGDNLEIRGDSTNVLTVTTNLNIISKDSAFLFSANMKDSSVTIGESVGHGAIKFKGGTTTTPPSTQPIAAGAYRVFRHDVTTAADTVLAMPDYWIKGKISNDYVKIPCYKYTP